MLALVLGVQGVSWGAWLSTSATAGTRDVQAATLPIPAAPSAAQVAGAKTVQLTWSAVADATNYQIRYYTTATGGTPATACSSAGTTCTDPVSRSGSSNFYSVLARAGTQWIAESPRTSYTSDDATTVAVAALGSDTGSSATDFITKTAANTLTGTAEAGATIVVKRAGSTLATATANGAGSWTSTSFTLNEGLQDLDAVATDGYANSATATRTNVRLDTVSPSAAQSATCATPGNPAPVGNWCKQTTLSMTATFSDAASGLAMSEYDNNGGGWTAYTGAVSLAEANGRVVQVRATDVAGNQTTSSVTYYIDGTAPTTVNVSPANGASFLTSSALQSALTAACGSGKSACGTAADTTSGVASTQFKLERAGTLISGCMNNSGVWATATCSSLLNSAFTTPNWNIAVAPSTAYPALSVLVTYTLTTRATDAAGNVGTNVVSSWTVTLL